MGTILFLCEFNVLRIIYNLLYLLAFSMNCIQCLYLHQLMKNLLNLNNFQVCTCTCRSFIHLVIYSSFFLVYLSIYPSIHPFLFHIYPLISDLIGNSSADCTAQLNQTILDNITVNQWWTILQTSSIFVQKENDDLEMIIFSERIAPPIFSYITSFG